jgi:hypothetical protein
MGSLRAMPIITDWKNICKLLIVDFLFFIQIVSEGKDIYHV